MYDEWLAEEKATKAAQKEALQAQQVQNAQVVASLAFGDTETPQSATIRAVTPDTAVGVQPGNDGKNPHKKLKPDDPVVSPEIDPSDR